MCCVLLMLSKKIKLEMNILIILRNITNHIDIYYFESKLFYPDVTFILIIIRYCFHFNAQAYNIMKQRMLMY